MKEIQNKIRSKVSNRRALFASSPASTTRKSIMGNALGILAILSVSGLLVYRSTQGIDLSDESYYALFFHDWIFGGLEKSQLRSLHQTASIVVYPFIGLYQTFAADVSGMFIFLRIMYVFGSVATAVSVVIALMNNRYGAKSWMAGLSILAFIPYGLPALSYNTLGLQGLVIGISGFAIWANIHRYRWTLISAAGWAISIVSYPPLAVALVGFLTLVLVSERCDRRFLMIYMFTVVLLVLGAIGLCTYALTVQRIIESYEYLSLINESTELNSRFQSVSYIFSSSEYFLVAFCVSLGVGAVRQLIHPILFLMYFLMIAVAAFQYDPALFVNSHDLIVLTCMAGLAIAGDLWSDDRARRLVAVAYAASIFAGLLTSAFATNTLYSFPIGGALAAVISVTWIPRRYEGRTGGIAPGVALVVSLVATSLSFRYGETPITRAEARVPIKTGVFAGLSVARSDAEIIHATEESLNEIMLPGETIAFIGRLPGLMLVSKSPIAMLTTFPLMPNVSSEGVQFTKSHYKNRSSLPRVLLIYRDNYFEPVNFLDDRMNEYELVRDLHLSHQRELKIYRLSQP